MANTPDKPRGIGWQRIPDRVSPDTREVDGEFIAISLPIVLVVQRELTADRATAVYDEVGWLGKVRLLTWACSG